MNQQEQQMIADLAERIRTAPAPQIDREADDLIRRTIGSRPDALYILTQTVLLQQMALDQAQDRLRELEQGPSPRGTGQGFLPGQPAAQPGYAQGGYAQSAYSQPVYEAPPPRSGFSSFLHNAAQTAAGVLAGEVAFDAISGIFGGHRGGFFQGGGIMPGGETIVNNYYGNEDRVPDDSGDSRFAQAADESDQNISPDIEDDRDDSGGGGGDDFAGGDDFSGDDSN
jgi:hypothetical protein